MASTVPQDANPQDGDSKGPATAPGGFRPVRGRAVLVSLLLVPLVIYATTGATQSHIFSLMVAPISALLILLLINFPLRHFAPKLSFSQSDLVVIFGVLSIASSVAGEWAWISQPSIHFYALFQDSNPQWKNTLLLHLPDWLIVKDKALVQDLQSGGRDLGYVLGKADLFWPRYLAWTLIISTVCFAMLCINSLMRGAWTVRERLTFPLIQLPVAMTENGGGGGMWRSKPMWIAFAVMFSIDILNGLNYLYPNLPAIPVKQFVDLNEMFKEPPLSNIGTLPVALFPFMAAIGLFMPSDLLLSFVVFYLLRKVTHVMMAANGVPQAMFSGTGIAPGPPYFDEQTWGGVIAMFLGAIYVSRDYLKQVWRDIRTGAREADGGVSHRWAFIGLMVSFAALVGLGMTGTLPLPYMVLYVSSFLIFSIVLTRIRAQLGPPTHEFAFFGSSALLHRFGGTRWITDKQATWVSQMFIVMNRIYRNHPMPYQLEAMKMGQIENLKQNRIFWMIAITTVVSVFLACIFLHAGAYRTGSGGWNDVPTYLSRIIDQRKGPDMVGIIMTLVGFVVVMLLDAIRFKIPSFPLHPAGYVLSMNYGVDYYWFGLLIALFVKTFVQRYYGLRGYDKLRNVALGILIGEYAAETIWMAMALITKQSTYTISFNDRSLGVQ
jgi:hypothetical protein